MASASSFLAWVLMSVIDRNNITILGSGKRPMLMSHGFGCDQNMWRFIAPAFERDFHLVLFDQVGAGGSELSAYDRTKYSTLRGYALDIIEICRELGLEDVVFVGHSVSAMIGALAAIEEPSLFERLVLVAPSPCYINDADYVGGFTREQVDGILDLIDTNYVEWSNTMAPVIMGNPERPELRTELRNSFCQTEPDIARHFARVTFLSDNRKDLNRVKTPSLILQCSNDALAPPSVGDYLHRHLPQSELARMQATGHCPHLSAPAETIAAMRAFV